MENLKDDWQKLLGELKDNGVSQDLLERVQTQVNKDQKRGQEIEEELKKFRLMVDWTPCTISWIKDDLTYAGVNKTLCEILGLEPEEFIGKGVGVHTHQLHFKEFSKELFNSKNEDHSLELSATFEGEEKQFYLVGKKFNNNKEAVIIGLDVTELARLQKSVGLMERLSALGEMVAGIVHEINNPLTVVKNKALMIPKYYEKGHEDRVIEASQNIEKTCDKMAKIIEGVKTFVRQGQHDPSTEAYLHDSLEEAKLLLETKLKEAGVSLKLPEGHGPLILANQTQLFQVFVNLITNSIDAIRDQKERWIQIETKEKDSNFVVIRFQDSGPGIPKDLREKIFQSFFTTKAKGIGTGLGLSLCKKIIENHQGQFTIDEKASHTTFVIEMPTDYGKKSEVA